MHLCMGCRPLYHPAQLNCSYTDGHFYVWLVCKDGMKMLRSKEWTQLQLFDVAARVLLAGMPLLLGRYPCWNTALFFIFCEW